MLPELPHLTEMVRNALAEDIGTGDITTLLTVAAETRAQAIFFMKEAGIVAGLPVVEEVFRQVDPTLQIRWNIQDGSPVQAQQILGSVVGAACSILTGERVALNFLQRLCGIATKTAHFVALAGDTQARIVDTRKTTPGLRILEKYAVRVGGGYNHRFGLYDAIMIKDNHIQAAGGITAAVELAFAQAPHTMTITVECATLEQVQEALEADADFLLLDNMTPAQLREAVALVAGNATLEASGGVNEETIAEIAQTGVDIISVGGLTHSARALDISLELSLLTT